MNFETMELWDAMRGVKYRRTLEQLGEMLRKAHGSLNEAIETALSTACKAVHAEAGTFWFYSRFGDGKIHARAWNGGADLSGIVLEPGEGIAGQVIETAQAIMIADCRKDARWAKKTDANTGFATKSMICVPLIAEDLVFGCIQLVNKTDGSLFDEEDLKFERRLAEEISNQFVKLNLLTDGKVEQDIAVLFVDMRGFTEIAAKMNPMKIAEMLNEYLSFVTEQIRAQGGIPDKYIGDCAMAYWKKSESCGEPAYMACKAADAMRSKADEFALRMKERYGGDIRFGIGINYGAAYLGNIGTSVLTDHTVVGHTVNMASQLEEAAPAGKIYISRAVADELGERAKVEFVEKTELIEMLSLEYLE